MLIQSGESIVICEKIYHFRQSLRSTVCVQLNEVSAVTLM
jgi:hypothetical protein